MTMIQEVTHIMLQMPKRKQQVVLDLLRMMNHDADWSASNQRDKAKFRRTGKAKFKLPADFDEHFDDMNDEIAAMFAGDQT